MADLAPTFAVEQTDDDQQRATYSASVTALTVAATPTDIFTITGAANKVIRILKIVFTGSQTTSAIRDILVIKRSAANTGGTATTQTNVPHDSTNAAASATVQAYTANPTGLGAAVGTLATAKYDIVATNLSSSTFMVLTFDWTTMQGKEPQLRSASEVLAVNLNSVTTSGSSLNIFITWSEGTT